MALSWSICLHVSLLMGIRKENRMENSADTDQVQQHWQEELGWSLWRNQEEETGGNLLSCQQMRAGSEVSWLISMARLNSLQSARFYIFLFFLAFAKINIDMIWICQRWFWAGSFIPKQTCIIWGPPHAACAPVRQWPHVTVMTHSWCQYEKVQDATQQALPKFQIKTTKWPEVCSNAWEKSQ